MLLKRGRIVPKLEHLHGQYVCLQSFAFWDCQDCQDCWRERQHQLRLVSNRHRDRRWPQKSTGCDELDSIKNPVVCIGLELPQREAGGSCKDVTESASVELLIFRCRSWVPQD